MIARTCALLRALALPLLLCAAAGAPALPTHGLSARGFAAPDLRPDMLHDDLTQAGKSDLPAALDGHLTHMATLLRDYPAVIEADPLGAPVLRHEILAFAPSPAGLAAARAAGLRIDRQEQALDQSWFILRAPEGTATAAALASLRAADPAGSYDFNHLYDGAAVEASAQAQNASAGAVQDAARQAGVIGLIDSGVERRHRAFRDAKIHLWGCNGTPHPAPHGTAVAALMVGKSARFRGVAPGATLYAADIYCDSPSGGSASQIVQALAWFAREQVGVINLSLVGPANLSLERMVAAMVKRGHLLVAAVGNDGPAAAPLFPASYPGVVGVSAVDSRRQALPEAARGPQVMFAAPGNDMLSAALGATPYRPVRGTSFAAPIVAALLAGTLNQPDPAGAKRAIARLAQEAGDAATPNPETGYGIVGEAFRINPIQPH